MIGLELGPVVGQTGGRVEIITEQVEIGASETRTWELPDGWEAGYIGARGTINGLIGTGRSITFFGQVTGGFGSGATGQGGFGALPSSIIAGNVTWSGTVTMIRTA